MRECENAVPYLSRVGRNNFDSLQSLLSPNKDGPLVKNENCEVVPTTVLSFSIANTASPSMCEGLQGLH